MSFIADKQTLDDLNLLGKYKSNSVYSLFNKVRTEGGEKLLDYMFRHPMTDHAAINRRSSVISFFGQLGAQFPFGREAVDTMSNYLASGGSSNSITATFDTLRRKTLHTMGLDKEFPLQVAGFHTTIQLLNEIISFLAMLDEKHPQHPFQEEMQPVKDLLSSARLQWLKKEKDNSRLPLAKFIQYDNLLRLHLREDMNAVLQLVYHIDVYIAVSDVARAKAFSYAQALPQQAACISLKACRHPGLERAVANSVTLQQNSNVLFLTGANMAGKSTFMKSFAIAVYLAHMGFPVAAEAMKFSVCDGIYTSINVPDNLQLGYSHFYAEVRRVKTVAEEVSAGKHLVVIFDELFKGTNVKDAYDATLAVTKAFAEYRNCCYIISTHIIEVADILKTDCDNLQLVFFPTIMEGNVPRYTYTLQQGVTSDRHGMMIIENEGIVDIIRGSTAIKSKQV
jgi:DNA mismatch repair ATPase MutS